MSDPASRVIPTCFLSIEGTDIAIYDQSLSRVDHVLDYRGLENKCYIRFIDDKYEEIEKLLAESETMELTHNWQDGPEIEPKKFYIRKFQVTYLERGCRVEIWGAEKPYAFEMDDKFRTFIDKTVSEIFEEITSEYGWDPIVEDTKGTHTLIQRNISDDRFIHEVLLPLAISSAGADKREYWFYGVNGKEVHFHTPDSDLKAYKTYSAHHDAEHPIKSFHTVQNDVDHCKGSAKLTVTGYDPMRKIRIKHEISKDDPGEQLKFAEKASDFKDEHGRYYRTPYHLERQIEGIAKNLWNSMSYSDNKAVLTLRADPRIEPGRIIEVDLVNHENGELLEKSGIYFIDKCTFTLVPNKKYDLVCNLSKNSHAFGNASASGTEVSASSEKSEKVTETSTFESDDSTVKKPINNV